MYERFKPLVESMYDDREERLIAGIAAQSAMTFRSEQREDKRC